jgi:hypothetical protein
MINFYLIKIDHINTYVISNKYEIIKIMSVLNRIINELPDLVSVIFNYFIECNDIFYITNFKFICKKVFDLINNHYWFNEFKRTFEFIHTNERILLYKSVIVYANPDNQWKYKYDYHVLTMRQYLIKLSRIDSFVFKNILLDSRINTHYNINDVFIDSAISGCFNNIKIILDLYPNTRIHYQGDLAMIKSMEHRRMDIIELLLVTSFKQKDYYTFNSMCVNHRSIKRDPLVNKKFVEIYEKHNIQMPIERISTFDKKLIYPVLI